MHYLIYNPAAHSFKKKKLNQMIDWLSVHNTKLTAIPTEYPGHASKIVTRLIEDGHNPEVILAAGGDGTITEVAQPLIGTEIPLGILPMGTANVLAAVYQLTNTTFNLETIQRRHYKKISVGKATFLKEMKESYFLLMCGVGLDAQVCKDVNHKLKNIIGKGAYALQTLQNLCQNKQRNFDVHTDKEVSLCQMLVTSLTSYYGGKFQLTPNANHFAKEFELCLLEKVNPKSLLSLFKTLSKANHQQLPNVTLKKSSTCTINCEQLPVQLDGDYYGLTPVKLEVIPDALNLIIPENK
jgi:YegS/Rv2252/BmrU family lipid kinase